MYRLTVIEVRSMTQGSLGENESDGHSLEVVWENPLLGLFRPPEITHILGPGSLPPSSKPVAASCVFLRTHLPSVHLPLSCNYTDPTWII